MQADIIAEKNVGMGKNNIRKAISHVKLEDEAYHERNIEYLNQEDDDYKSPWKEYASDLRAVTDSSDSGEITFKKPAARKEPSKTLKLRNNQSEDLTLAKEFVIQKVDPPTWTQSSHNSISLVKEDLGLLAGEPIPKASFKEGKT